MLILNMCIDNVRCPVLRAELLSMPRLVKLKTHPLFQPVAWNWYTLPLSIVTFRWYCFTFSWKGMCMVWTHTSDVVCCMCVHVIPVEWFTFSEECVESLIHIHFKPPIQSAKITMQNIFPTQPLRKRPQNNVSVFKKKNSSIFSCGLASVGVCLHA